MIIINFLIKLTKICTSKINIVWKIFTKEHKMKKTLHFCISFLFFSFALLFLSFNKLTNFENENMLLNKFYQNCEKTIVEIKEIDGEINFKRISIKYIS